jgi:peroxisomal 2,4-dienoyl-CoA reductase
VINNRTVVANYTAMAIDPQTSPFNDSILSHRVALVTGGGSGIGLEITRQLGLHGATVVISGRRDHVLGAACSSLSPSMTVSSVVGDVRKYGDCQRMVSETISRYGKLDIVINCAAGNFLALAEQLSSNGFKTVMEIDTLGTFNVCRASFDSLKRNESSIIVNISATLHYGATWYQAHASAAKAAIDSLTRSIALEWGAHGIRVNGIAPGPIQGTAGLKKLAGVDGDGKTLEDMVKEKIPVGRAGTAWDIAMAVVYLCSNAGSFVSGHTMVVDGAEWMWRPPVVPREDVEKVSRKVEGASRNVINGEGQERLPAVTPSKSSFRFKSKL